MNRTEVAVQPAATLDRRRPIVVLIAIVLGAGAVSQWWAGRHDEQLGHRMAMLAAPGDIRLLSSTTCAHCAAPRQWLQQHGVPFGQCFIETDAECAAQYKAARVSGTPVLLVAGQAQLGFNAQRVHDALSAKAARKLTPG